MQNDKKLDIRNLSQKENIIEQAIKGEARFLKGLIGYSYKSVFTFCLAYCWGLFYCIIGGVSLIILITALIQAIHQRVTSHEIVFVAVFLLLFSTLLITSGIRVTIKLASTMRRRDKRFKIIASLSMSVLSLITILLLVFIFYTFQSVDIVF